MSATKARVVIIDDMASIIHLMRMALNGDPDIEIAGTSLGGREGVELVRALKPDVVTTDLLMPDFDGVQVTREIMRTMPTPIIVVTAHADDLGNIRAFDAIREGAVQIVEKPSGFGGTSFEAFQSLLRRAIKGSSHLRLIPGWTAVAEESPALPSREGTGGPGPGPKGGSPARFTFANHSRPAVIGIGSSCGGPLSVERLLSGLDPGFKVPIVIAQHLLPGFQNILKISLSRRTAIRIVIAEDSQQIEPGTAYLPGDHHDIEVDPRGRIRLFQRASQKGPCPSIDRLMRSMAESYRSRSVGILLSGLGEDGTEGLTCIKRSGGMAIVESPSTAAVPFMSMSAVRGGADTNQGSLDEIRGWLVRMAQQ